MTCIPDELEELEDDALLEEALSAVGSITYPCGTSTRPYCESACILGVKCDILIALFHLESLTAWSADGRTPR